MKGWNAVMSKADKSFMRTPLITIIVLGLAIIAVSFLMFCVTPGVFSSGSGEDADPKAIAEQFDNVAYDKKSELLYINNEVIIAASSGTTKEQMEELADENDAELDTTLADIGYYVFRYSKGESLAVLEDRIAFLEESKLVQSAFVDTLVLLGSDDADDEEEEETIFFRREPAYPDDQWNDASWNMYVPQDENWGMEAIAAPGAWAYRNQMEKVKIGMIGPMPNEDHEDLAVEKVTNLFIDDMTGEVTVNTYVVEPDDHSTHVAGIINGTWAENGSYGVSGAAGGMCELYTCGVYLDSNGTLSGKYSTAYAYLVALKTLIDEDVRVINVSQNTDELKSFAASRGNENAINYLERQAELVEEGLSRIIQLRQAEDKSDFVICVSAGNSNDTYYYKDKSKPYDYRSTKTFGETISTLLGRKGLHGKADAKYNNFLNLIDEESVMDRIIVVGSVGIDGNKSTPKKTYFAYSSYSNIGERVDVVAPGEDIYSSISNRSYKSMSGTSASTAHASGVAGMIWASNLDLTGPEVKRILCTTASGRYYYGEHYSGLVDAETAVIAALNARNVSVSAAIDGNVFGALDICFVIDSTASMKDELENIQKQMDPILAGIEMLSSDYRVAIVDYRTVADKNGKGSAYPSQLQLNFTSDLNEIATAIKGMSAPKSNKDDVELEKTVYSGVMEAADLDWRFRSKKVIILIGDTAPAKTETGSKYTYDSVLKELTDDKQITVYTVGSDATSEAKKFLKNLADDTGGSYRAAGTNASVSDVILKTLKDINPVPTHSVELRFNDIFVGETIDLYSYEGEYLFSFTPNSKAKVVISEIAAAPYKGSCERLGVDGTFKINDDTEKVTAKVSDKSWLTAFMAYWDGGHRSFASTIIILTVIAVAIPVIVTIVMRIRLSVLKSQVKKKQQEQQEVI